MNSITQEYIREYLFAIQEPKPDYLMQIRTEAEKRDIPIIKFEMQDFLEWLLMLHKPMKILEIGTAVGFSAITMSRFLPEGGHITTLERSPMMIEWAKRNFELAGVQQCVTMLEGEAIEILPTLTETYDLIFMDAAKAQYMAFFPFCLERLRVGGILVSDNVLQEGYIPRTRFALPRRQRTIHTRMRQYLYEISHHEQLKTAIMPMADGVTVSYKVK